VRGSREGWWLFCGQEKKDALETHKNTQPEREACEQECGISRGNSVQEAMHL
jgi:hypothetical protein